MPYFASTWTLSEKEQSVADWAFRRRQPAGFGTDTLNSTTGLHLSLVAGDRAVGVLSLHLQDSTPLTILTVSDDGPGQPTDAVPHIFDKSYRAPSAPAGGTGLSLAIVKGFAELSGSGK